MTMDETIEISYQYNNWSGAAYRTGNDGVRRQICYMILPSMGKTEGHLFIQSTLIRVLRDTRPPRPTSWRCRFYDAMEWVDTHILRHRIYRFCQWAAVNAANECHDSIQIIDKTNNTPENTTYFEWSGDDDS